MNLLRNATAGVGIAVAAATALTALPASATSTAAAASAIRFSNPAKGVRATDNVTYAVATPVLGKAQVGKVATVTLAGPATPDCRSLWLTHNGIAFHALRATCTSSRTVVSFVITRAMVGQRVTLTGWSQVRSAGTVVVNGKVVIGRSVTTTHGTAHRPVVTKPLPPTKPTKPTQPTPAPSVTPSPTPSATPTAAPTATPTTTPTQTTPAAPQPIGPLTVLGSFNGQQVALASANGSNEVWIGSTRYAALPGDILHASFDGTAVHLWQQGSNELVHWTLDAASGNPSVSKLAGTIPDSTYIKFSGKPGFWLRHQVPGGLWEDTLYNWSGTSITSYPYNPTGLRSLQVGFTDTHAIVKLGGQSPSEVHMIPTDGSPEFVATTRLPIFATQSIDATGVTFRLMGDNSLARVEPGKPIVYTQG